MRTQTVHSHTPPAKPDAWKQRPCSVADLEAAEARVQELEKFLRLALENWGNPPRHLIRKIDRSLNP